MTRLTDAMIRQAPARAARYELSEDSGLAVRVSPAGGKSFVWRYRTPAGQQRRLTLGRYPALSLAEARQRVAAAAANLAAGGDPAPRPERVSDLIAVYLNRHASKLRTVAEETRRLRVDIEPHLGHKRVVDVTRRDVANIAHAAAERIRAARPGATGVGANRVLGAMQRLFGRAVAWGWIEANPADRVEKPIAEHSRDRVLTDEEIFRLWRLAAPPASTILQLCLLTGCRVGEITGAALAEVDLSRSRWILPACRSKNGREHVIPLSPLAAHLIATAIVPGSRWLFPGFTPSASTPVLRTSINRALTRAIRRAGLQPFTPHDLRRTAATRLISLGVAPHVVEAVLNHASGHRSGVAGIYNRHSYATEMREALDQLAEHVAAVANVEPPAPLATPMRQVDAGN